MRVTRIALFVSVGWLSACATHPCPEFDRYSALKDGVDPLTSDEITPAGVGYLQCLAARGNKQAQYRLGYALENGISIEQDYSQAAMWYRRAAEDVVATSYVYQGAVGERDARVIPVGEGGIRPGLPDARYALALLYLEGNGVDRDQDGGGPVAR